METQRRNRRSSKPEQLEQTVDRRQSERFAAAGEVVLLLESPQFTQIRGELMDISETGFRMAHRCLTLGSGQTVVFMHSLGKGKARVAWNRVVGDSVESGFTILSDTK
jgi:hypothetical protein